MEEEKREMEDVADEEGEWGVGRGTGTGTSRKRRGGGGWVCVWGGGGGGGVARMTWLAGLLSWERPAYSDLYLLIISCLMLAAPACQPWSRWGRCSEVDCTKTRNRTCISGPNDCKGMIRVHARCNCSSPSGKHVYAPQLCCPMELTFPIPATWSPEWSSKLHLHGRFSELAE